MKHDVRVTPEARVSGRAKYPNEYNQHFNTDLSLVVGVGAVQRFAGSKLFGTTMKTEELGSEDEPIEIEKGAATLPTSRLAHANNVHESISARTIADRQRPRRHNLTVLQHHQPRSIDIEKNLKITEYVNAPLTQEGFNLNEEAPLELT